jgi:hypothetical protein
MIVVRAYDALPYQVLLNHYDFILCSLKLFVKYHGHLITCVVPAALVYLSTLVYFVKLSIK